MIYTVAASMVLLIVSICAHYVTNVIQHVHWFQFRCIV